MERRVCGVDLRERVGYVNELVGEGNAREAGFEFGGYWDCVLLSVGFGV